MPAPLLLIASAGRRSALAPVLRSAGLAFAESDPSDHPKNFAGFSAALLDLELPEAAVILAHAKGAGACVVALVPRGGDPSLAQGLWGLGLDDLVREEAMASELAPRLQARMRERDLLQEASRRESEMAALVDLTRALVSSGLADDEVGLADAAGLPLDAASDHRARAAVHARVAAGADRGGAREGHVAEHRGPARHDQGRRVRARRGAGAADD